MKDGLEKFVGQNRVFMDSEEPSPLVWEGIEQHLEGKSKHSIPLQKGGFRIKLYRYASVAAAALVLMTIGGIIWSQFGPQPEPTKILTFGTISPEYAELESFYAKQVSTQLKQLNKYRYDKDIMEDIAELDTAFKDLRDELGKDGTVEDDEIIDAMIENYQTKIEILERVLLRIKKDKAAKAQQTKQQKNEINL